MMYIASGNRLKTYDINDIQNPVLLDSALFGNWEIFDMALEYPYIFIVEASSSVFAFDISDPTNIIEAGYHSTSGESFGVVEKDGLVYIADRYSLGIYDFALLEVNDPLKKQFPIFCDLLPVYPNPFNSETNLLFSLPKAGKVTLAIYNIQGREVARLINGFQPAGTYQRTFDATDLSSGVYFACLKADGFSQTRKLLLIK